MYAENIHELDILDILEISNIGHVVDITYSYGTIWKRMQFS